MPLLLFIELCMRKRAQGGYDIPTLSPRSRGDTTVMANRIEGRGNMHTTSGVEGGPTHELEKVHLTFAQPSM